MYQSVVRTEFFGQRPGEAPFAIIIEIGKPYQRGTDPEEWACPVSLAPLYEQLADAAGGDALQALCMAASLILDLLEGFGEAGGTLSYEGSGDQVPLDAYAFGPAGKQGK